MANVTSVVRFAGVTPAKAALATVTLQEIPLDRTHPFLKAEILLVGSDATLGIASASVAVRQTDQTLTTAVPSGTVSLRTGITFAGQGLVTTDTSAGVRGYIIAVEANANTTTAANTVANGSLLLGGLTLSWTADANPGTRTWEYTIDVYYDNADLYTGNPVALTSS